MGTETWVECDKCGGQGFASVGPSPCRSKVAQVVYNACNGETVHILDDTGRGEERGQTTCDPTCDGETTQLLYDITGGEEAAHMLYDHSNVGGEAGTQVETVVECGSGGRWKVEVAAGGSTSDHHHHHHMSILHYTKAVMWKAWNSVSPSVLLCFTVPSSSHPPSSSLSSSSSSSSYFLVPSCPVAPSCLPCPCSCSSSTPSLSSSSGCCFPQQHQPQVMARNLCSVLLWVTSIYFLHFCYHFTEPCLPNAVFCSFSSVILGVIFYVCVAGESTSFINNITITSVAQEGLKECGREHSCGSYLLTTLINFVCHVISF